MSAAEARRRALLMASERAWSAYAISNYLTRNGYAVSEWTVKRWIDPGYAERERERQRGRMRASARAKRGTLTRVRVLDAQALDARAHALHAAGLSCAAVCKVLKLDHDVDISEHQVRRSLLSGNWPIGKVAA